jgi:hypothetical protein
VLGLSKHERQGSFELSAQAIRGATVVCFINPCPAVHGRAFVGTASGAREASRLTLRQAQGERGK